MKKLITFFMAFFVVGNANAFVDRQNAVITILDKTAGKVHNMTVAVGIKNRYEKLNFIVRACKETDPFMAENAYMFIEIATPNDGQIFGGWMNKNEPGENPLQNADYDLWLVRCE